MIGSRDKVDNIRQMYNMYIEEKDRKMAKILKKKIENLTSLPLISTKMFKYIFKTYSNLKVEDSTKTNSEFYIRLLEIEKYIYKKIEEKVSNLHKVLLFYVYFDVLYFFYFF